MRSESAPAPGWWRRNRWGLIALPVVLVLAVAGNGIRLDDYWWNTGLHSATAGPPGEFVRFHEDYSDAVGDTSRTVEVRLDSVEDITEIPAAYSDPQVIPEGLRGVRVDLSFRAEPDQALSGCFLALLDANGDRYQFDDDMVGIRQTELSPCHVFGQSGPEIPWAKGQERVPPPPDQERPATWEMHPVVLVPEDAEITHVLLWWGKPDYLKLRIRG